MKTNRALLFLSILLFAMGCKQENSKNTNIKKEKEKEISKINNSDSIPPSSAETKNIQDKGFVISCGSGCAMNYNAENMIRTNSSSVKVKFKVEMYMDEQLSDTYYETYIFYYNPTNKIEKIEQEGKTENILKTFMPDAQESFKDFANEIK